MQGFEGSRRRLTIVQWVYRVDHQLQQTVSEFGPGCGLILMNRNTATTRTGRPRPALRGRPRRHRTARLRRHRRLRRVGRVALQGGGGGETEQNNGLVTGRGLPEAGEGMVCLGMKCMCVCL